MSRRLEWVLQCCLCRKEERSEARYSGILADDLYIEVDTVHFDYKGWESDGLGGWMCPECYEKYEGERRL